MGPEVIGGSSRTADVFLRLVAIGFNQDGESPVVWVVEPFLQLITRSRLLSKS